MEKTDQDAQIANNIINRPDVQKWRHETMGRVLSAKKRGIFHLALRDSCRIQADSNDGDRDSDQERTNNDDVAE